MALDLSQLPDQPGQSKLNLNALPDKPSAAPVEQPEPLLPRVAAGIERLTAPIGRAVEAVTEPFVKTALDISLLPDKVQESAIPDIAKPVVRTLAEQAVAPVKLGLGGLQVAGAAMQGLEKAGEYVAEKGGELGVPPEIAAGAGTLISKAPDIAATVTGGKALLKIASTAARKKAAKQAFIAMSEEIKKLPKQPDLQLGEVEQVSKPVMKLEQFKAATKQPTGEVTVGHKTGAIQKQYMDLLNSGKEAEAKAFLQSELQKKGFVTKEGEFISPDKALELIEAQGPAAGKGLAQELPFPSSKSGVAPKPIPEGTQGIELSRKDILDINKKAKTNLQVPEEQLDLFERMPSKAKPTEPIKLAAKEDKRLLEGSKERLAKFKSTTVPDVDPKNPLTSRVELNQKLGELEKTATEQLKAGAELSAAARTDSLNTQAKFIKDFKIKPETLDSDVLFAYAESPNKAESYARLSQLIGKEEATKVKGAAEYMQKVHDYYFNKVNEVRAQNGLKAIPYRQNYVAHFHEFNLLERLGLVDKVGTAEGAQLVEELSRPVQNNIYGRLKDVVFNHVKRQGQESMQDAASAFNRYVSAAENYIKMQPYVNELNATADIVKTRMPNLSSYIRDQADFIAGKESAIDAGVEYVFSKPFLQGMYALQQNAVKNVVQGSTKVAATQLFGELPTFASHPIRDFANGAIKQVMSPEVRALAYQNSQVLKDRALDLVERNLTAGPVSKQLNNLTAFFDYEVVNHAWITSYLANLRKGLPQAEAIMKAEEFASLANGLTNPVNTPPALRSKTFQALMPLQNQQIAYARYLTQQMWKGKTLTEKSAIAAKAAISGSALAGLQYYMFGDRGESPLNPTNWVPLGGILQRGIGGPVLSSAGDFINAKTQEGKIRALIRAAFLLQRPIPAGAMVGRAVEKAVLGEKKNAR